MALAWVLQNPAVSAAIIGATRPAQVAENVKAVGIELDASVMAAIDETLAGVIVTNPDYTKSPEERP